MPAGHTGLRPAAALLALLVALGAAVWLSGPAPAPTDITVAVASPADGATLSSPVARVLLSATAAGGDLQRVDRLCVLVDGQRSTCARPSDPLLEVVLLRRNARVELRGIAVSASGAALSPPSAPVHVVYGYSDLPSHAVRIVRPVNGSIVAEGMVDIELEFAHAPPPPDSLVEVHIAGQEPTVVPAATVELMFEDYGTFTATVRVVQWGGVDVPAAPVASVIFDTRADPADYGREPAGWPPTPAPAMSRPLRMLYVGDLGGMDGQKGVYLSQFRLLPREWFPTTLADLTCQPPEVVNDAYVAAVEAAGVRIARFCLPFPPGVASTAEMVARLRVLHAVDAWAAVPPELQTMLVEVYLLMRGQDVLVVGNSPEVEIDYIVQLARLAQVPTRVVDMGGWGPKTPVNPHSVTAFLGSSHFVTQHPALQQYGVPSYVVNPAVDMDKFRPGLPKGGGPIVLGMLGRLSREKNPGVFVSMAALLPSERFKFVVYGDGPQRPALEQYAALRGADIEWVGFVDNDDLPERLHALDLLVCPILQHDTFTIANIEAMAAGIPVAGFAYGGMRGYMQHGVNSLVTDDYTAEGLARLVSSVSRPQLQQLGRSARQFVAGRYNPRDTAARYAAFYAGVAGV